MLNRILMLHIKKPLNFHLIKYQPPVPLREKWGRNVKRKKNVARLKALGTVWCASDGGLYSFCTLYHMTWLFVKCSQTAWGEFLRLEETFLLLRKVLSPLLWVEKWKCVVMGMREEMVGMSKSRATSLREAWGHSNAPAKLCLCLLWWLPASAVWLPGLPSPGYWCNLSWPQNSRQLDYIPPFHHLIWISLLILNIQ